MGVFDHLVSSFVLIAFIVTVCRCSVGMQMSRKEIALIEELLDGSSMYDSRICPGTMRDEPLVVYLELFVNDISSITAVDMSFSLNVFLRQVWVDERLTYENHTKPLTLDHKQFNRIWTPDLFVRNEKQGHFHDITVPNRLIRIYPNGTVLYSQRLSLKLSCWMDLKRYPMDNQTCELNIGSYGYVVEDLVFQWRNVSKPIEVSQEVQLPEFFLIGTERGDCQKSYSSTGSFTCVYVRFLLQRRFEFYAIQTYVPSILVVVVSWVSFWIDMESAPARISVGLLTVLTITTQSVSIMERLPRVSYVKGIDVWMVSSLIFVFSALLEYSLVNFLARRRKVRTELKKQATIRQRYEERKLLNKSSDGDEGKQQFDYDPYIPPPPSNSMSSNTWLDRSPLWRRISTDKAMMVDVLSRVFFPIAYLVFNIFYWSIYSVRY